METFSALLALCVGNPPVTGHIGCCDMVKCKVAVLTMLVSVTYPDEVSTTRQCALAHDMTTLMYGSSSARLAINAFEPWMKFYRRNFQMNFYDFFKKFWLKFWFVYSMAKLAQVMVWCRIGWANHSFHRNKYSSLGISQLLVALKFIKKGFGKCLKNIGQFVHTAIYSSDGHNILESTMIEWFWLVLEACSDEIRKYHRVVCYRPWQSPLRKLMSRHG